MQIAVKDRQSLADIAVEYLGGVEGIFALAERNGISITARLEDGQTLVRIFCNQFDDTFA